MEFVVTWLPSYGSCSRNLYWRHTNFASMLYRASDQQIQMADLCQFLY